MPKKPKNTACFYLTPQSLLYFARDKDAAVELVFSIDIARDQEIISEPSLERVLITWMEQYKIVPNQGIMILDDNILYYTHVTQLPATKQDQAVVDFLDMVPFDEAWVENFPVADGAYITAVNYRFLKPVISVLERIGFVIVGAVPAFALGVDFTQTPMSPEIAVQTLENQVLIDQYNFISKAEIEAKTEEEEPFLSFSIDAKVIGMICAFLVLLGFLLVLLRMQGMI